MGMNEIYNIKLTNIELKKDEITGGYYLDVTYEYEDDRGCYEICIPHIMLPFFEEKMPNISTSIEGWNEIGKINFGDDELTIIKGRTKHMDNEHSALYSLKVLKEKHQEMTLEEVEKKLGYKIKLVTKKEEE